MCYIQSAVCAITQCWFLCYCAKARLTCLYQPLCAIGAGALCVVCAIRVFVCHMCYLSHNAVCVLVCCMCYPSCNAGMLGRSFYVLCSGKTDLLLYYTFNAVCAILGVLCFPSEKLYLLCSDMTDLLLSLR